MEQDLVAVDPDLVAITMNQPFHYGSIPLLKTALEKFAPALPFGSLHQEEGAKFQLSQSPPSCFLTLSTTFLKIFKGNLLAVFHLHLDHSALVSFMEF